MNVNITIQKLKLTYNTIYNSNILINLSTLGHQFVSHLNSNYHHKNIFRYYHQRNYISSFSRGSFFLLCKAHDKTSNKNIQVKAFS